MFFLYFYYSYLLAFGKNPYDAYKKQSCAKYEPFLLTLSNIFLSEMVRKEGKSSNTQN